MNYLKIGSFEVLETPEFYLIMIPKDKEKIINVGG